MFEKLRELLRLNNQLIEAEDRKRHYESRVVEMMRPRRNEGMRRLFIERLARDIYETDREIERISAELGALKEA